MKKSSVLMMSVISMSLSFVTGCNSTKYKDNSRLLNKTTLGEASINNINKYTAIGVGKLDKSSPNKKYRLITDKNDDNEEDAPYEADLSNTLIGLTTEGVLEELSLTIQSGQSVDSTNFNVTFFQEVGDFVVISILPMDVSDYISGIVGDDLTTVENDKNGNPVKKHHIAYKECVAYAIDHLVYPLKYSVRYYDLQTKDYKFVDTSYLIHKQSGKIFPFSSHSYCIDPKKCRNGEFLNPTVILKNDATSYPINHLVIYEGLESLIVDYYCDPYINKPKLTIPKHGNLFFSNCFEGVKTFINGFVCKTPTSYCPDLTKPNTFYDGNGEYLHSVVFDETSSSLMITEMIVNGGNSDTPVYFSGTVIDVFGNLLGEYNDKKIVYNVNSKEYMRLEQKLSDAELSSFSYDPWSRHFFSAMFGSENGDEFAPGSGSLAGFKFYNEQFEKEYFLPGDAPFVNSGIGIYEFLDKSIEINDKTRLTASGKTISRIFLDENYHYHDNMTTVLFEAPSDIFYYDKEKAYYYQESVIHVVDINTLNDSVLASLEDYPFVESVFMTEIGLIRFEGMDNQLNVIVGYVYPDGTISFDISEFEASSQTTTLSPIN